MLSARTMQWQAKAMLGVQEEHLNSNTISLCARAGQGADLQGAARVPPPHAG